jgi:ankyrin repeat protein
LHCASYNGKLKIAQVLLDHGAKVDAAVNSGHTPLHYVSQCGSEEAGVGVARLLLEHGGDVNRQSKTQQTPLHYASYNGKPKIARLLLDHGAKVDAVDDNGETPFHDVSQSDSEEAGVGVAWLLLEHGWDVNRQNKTCYESTTRCARLECLQFSGVRSLAFSQRGQ